MVESPTSAETVLIADADPASGQLLARSLREEGYHVVHATTGAETLDVLSREPVKIVVADARVPGLDLDELVRRRSDAGDPPLLLLFGSLPFDVEDRRRRARAAGFLLKPVEPAELAARVRALLRERPDPSAADQLLLAARAWAGEETQFREICPDILFALPAWLLVVDSHLRIRFANRSILDFLGKKFAGVAGEELGAVLTAGILEGREAVATIRGTLEEGRPGNLAGIRVRTPAGSERSIDLQATPIDMPGGRHVLAIFHDVTGHFLSRETMRQEKRKLEEIVNGMGASLAVLDPELKVRWANKTFEKWFGEMWGKRFHYALRGLFLVGDLDPARIFTEAEYMSKEWAHIDGHGNRRYYRNIILPAHDPAGTLEELILVTQDLTEVTLRAEQHRLLRDLANLLQTTLELDRLLYIILTCLTAGHALGFNRAFVFLTDPAGERIAGRMGVGPSTREEAFTIWADLAASRRSLMDLTMDYERFRSLEPGHLTRLARGLSYPLNEAGADREIVARTVLENRMQIVRDAWADPRVTPEFRDRFGVREFACTPLQSKGRVLGVLVVDNVFSDRAISEEQAGMLELFSAAAGLAVDNAGTYAELKKSLEQLEKAQEAAIQAERLATVGRLAAHVAHEIRNPLVTIGGFAASVRRKPGDVDRVSRAADIIYEEVLRLEAILSGVMDFTRPGRLELRTQNVNDVVRKIVDPLGEELREKEVELRLELGDVPEVPLDEKQVHQALLNLVRNAIESLESKERPPRPRRLVVRTEARDGRVRVAVEDNGEGVPEDLRPVLFEPFISGKTRGTGVGLAVVRKILLDHGGDVTVDSVRGEGATFTLCLPIPA